MEALKWETVERVAVVVAIVAGLVGAIVGIATLIAMLASVSLPGFSSGETTPHTVARPVARVAPAARMTTSSTGTSIVFNVDITISVSQAFVDTSLKAIAASVPRLVRPDRGPVRIYLRLISPSPGDDSAAVATYTIPGIRRCANAFDQRCRHERARDLARARARARTIAADIRDLHLKRTRTRTIIRGAFAADADILASSKGAKWLVAATDLRPSGAPPEHPDIGLHGVRVVIVLACEQSIEKCQARKRIWRTELLNDGAASVTFLTAQQSDLLFTDGIGG